MWMKQELKQQIGQSVQGFRLPRYQEIPDVGLYLEQATKYINNDQLLVVSDEFTKAGDFLLYTSGCGYTFEQLIDRRWSPYFSSNVP